MRNLWTRPNPYDTELIWTAELGPLTKKPEALLIWIEEYLAICNSTQILVPYGLSAVNADFYIGDTFFDNIKYYYQRTGCIDLLSSAFYDLRSTAHPVAFKSLMAVWANEPSPTEVMIGDVLKDLTPILGAEKIEELCLSHSLSFADHSGAHLDTNDFESFKERKYSNCLAFSIFAWSDIWLPWIPSGLVQGRRCWLNNLPLARNHTPRLNRFLREVRKMTLAMGGEWDYEPRSWPFNRPDGIDISLEPESYLRVS